MRPLLRSIWRLIKQGETLRSQRFAQGGIKLLAGMQPRIHAGLEQSDADALARLGIRQRHIGVAQHRFGIRAGED